MLSGSVCWAKLLKALPMRVPFSPMKPLEAGVAVITEAQGDQEPAQGCRASKGKAAMPSGALGPHLHIPPAPRKPCPRDHSPHRLPGAWAVLPVDCLCILSSQMAGTHTRPQSPQRVGRRVGRGVSLAQTKQAWDAEPVAFGLD